MNSVMINPSELLALHTAAGEFLDTNDSFEKPVDHSPTDHILETRRARITLRDSVIMRGGPFILEVSQPIRDFAKDAKWLFAVAYLDPRSPEGAPVGHVTLQPEGPVLLPDEGLPYAGDLCVSLLLDLH